MVQAATSKLVKQKCSKGKNVSRAPERIPTLLQFQNVLLDQWKTQGKTYLPKHPALRANSFTLGVCQVCIILSERG